MRLLTHYLLWDAAVIFKLISGIDITSISREIAVKSIPQDLTKDQSILVQVIPWCRQKTNHYLTKCWLSPVTPYGVTKPQKVNWWTINLPDIIICHMIITLTNASLSLIKLYVSWRFFGVKKRIRCIDLQFEIITIIWFMRKADITVQCFVTARL